MKKGANLVWTSDPDAARRLRDSGNLEAIKDLPPEKQSIRVQLDRKRRAGKTVTLSSGFELSAASLAELTQRLKKKCGSGGTARESEIEIQGDHVTLILAELQKLGYKARG